MPHIAYTVDRLGSLDLGDSVEPEQHADVKPRTLQAHVDYWFPAGVTSHGERYLLRPAPATLFDPSVELTCELIRRAEFPCLPSRFQSLFGCETVADAHAFLARFGEGCPKAQIMEVETESKPFRADMRCLDIRGSILVMAYGARRYWKQHANDLGSFPGADGTAPFWELLLPPPVRVLRRVFGPTNP